MAGLKQDRVKKEQNIPIMRSNYMQYRLSTLTPFEETPSLPERISRVTFARPPPTSFLQRG